MNIIFLDIDGVLCTRRTLLAYGDFGRPSSISKDKSPLFDPVGVNMLRKLVEVTDARIVISSSWRFGCSVEDFRLGLEKYYGWPNAPIISNTKRESFTARRGDEIQAWLDEHPDVSSFVIIDDDSDMEHLMDRLVKCEFDAGLNHTHIEQAAALLGVKDSITLYR